MKSEKIIIWNQEEYTYPMAFGFVPNMVSYIHDEDEKERPCMLVVPGGGYCIVSPTEGEIVAKEFFEDGFNAFVLTYTTNFLMTVPLKNQPMKDLSRAIRYIRKNAKTLHIDPKQLAVCGFSAGGHLCASICVHYKDVPEEKEEYKRISNRPDAAILSYPVITSGEKAHRDSFRALLGDDATEEELAYMSLEKQVTSDTPPCFLWQTVTDELVPVENSCLFAKACKENGVPYAHHIFSEGRHGLSLANELWASGEFGKPYTMEQIDKMIEAVKNGNLTIPEEEKELLLSQFGNGEENEKAVWLQNQKNEEVEAWPLLAMQWLKTLQQRKQFRE